MVKQDIKAWKTTWFRNDDDNGGAMADCITKCGHDEVVVHSHTNKYPRLYANVSPTHLLKLLESNKGIFECLSHYPKKVYFDIDCKKKEMGDKFASYFNHHKEYLEDCCDIIGDSFRNADLAISGSITDYAISFHITLTNYIIQNKEQLETMKYIVKEMRVKEPTFDDKVYTRNRFMKAVNQSKPNDDRIQNILINNNIKDHLITCFFSANPLPFPELKPAVLENVRVEQAKKSINMLADLPKLDKIKLTELQQHLLNEYELEQLTPSQMLVLMPLDKSFPHSHTWRMCRFAFHNEIPLQEFIAWYRQKNDDQDSINKYTQIHYPNAYKYAQPSMDQIRKLLMHFYPKFAKDIHYRKFSNTFELPAEKIQKIETISQECYTGQDRCVIFNVGMGGGKTHQTIEYLTGEPSFCWVCPNRALAHNTETRLVSKDIPVAHYERFTKKEKEEGVFDNINRLIIVANSLHYIKQKAYHTVVIDEIETMLDKWEGSFINNNGNKLASWNAFINIFRNAKKIILLDAFVTTKTLTFLECIGITNYTIYERMVEPVTRHIQYYNNFEVMLKMIIEDLKAKKKIFIFYPYKDGTEKYLSMVSFANMLELACEVKGSYYNADIDDKKKEDVKDVNFSWCNKNFIITNNMITCGVNYDTDEPSEQFDKKYIFVAAMNSPRDIIQVSYRARALKDNLINVCFLGRMMQNNIWEDDSQTIMAGCPIYKSLYANILVEKKAPLRKTFTLFANKAHYIQHTEKKTDINDAIVKEIQDLQEKYNIDFDFSQVEDIDHSYAEVIHQKTIIHDATMIEKVMLKKYHFLANFTEASRELVYDRQENISFVSYLWNNNMLKFVDKIFEDSDKPTSVFKSLKNAFGWETIFPSRVDYKMKIPETVKEQFFKEFQYKFCTMKSKLPHLLTITYNGYFGKEIIKRVYTSDKSNCITHIIDHEELTPLYEFCMKNRFIAPPVATTDASCLFVLEDEAE
jgi:hypothetical protein